MLYKVLFLAFVVSADAQFGRKKEQHAAGSLGDMGGVQDNGLSDVDLASERASCLKVPSNLHAAAAALRCSR